MQHEGGDRSGSPDGAKRNPGARSPQTPAPGFAALNPGTEEAESEEERRERLRLERSMCHWLKLHHVCGRARCRRAGECCGDPAACLEACKPVVPEPVRDFVLDMMEAQAEGHGFEQAWAQARDRDAYVAWIAGLQAAAKR